MRTPVNSFVPRTTQNNGFVLSGSMDFNKEVQQGLDMTSNRLSPKDVVKTCPVSFTQIIQKIGMVSVPTSSDMIPCQLSTMKAHAYPDFYLSDSVISRLSHAMYAAAIMTTPNGNQAAIVEMENLHYSAKTYNVD